MSLHHINLLYFIQHFKFSDSLLFLGIYFCILNGFHIIYFHILKALLLKSLLLGDQIRIFPHPNKVNASIPEVFDHHFPKPIIWTKHFVIHEIAKIEIPSNVLQKIIYHIRVNVDQNALREEECWLSGTIIKAIRNYFGSIPNLAILN